MMMNQDPRRVDTKSLNMVLSRLSPSALDSNTNFTKDDLAGFKFPFSAITDDKAKLAKFIDSVVS